MGERVKIVVVIKRYFWLWLGGFGGRESNNSNGNQKMLLALVRRF